MTRRDIIVLITDDHLLAVVSGAEWHWLVEGDGLSPAYQIDQANRVVTGELSIANIYGYGGEVGHITRNRLAQALADRLRSLDVDDQLAQMDVTDYDVILQTAIFGDVIYD